MVCLVLWCLWLIFDFASVGVCVSEEEADDKGVGFANGEERGKKLAKLEIIKIMYRRATITVHIYTVTVALVHLCTNLHPLMWVFFCQNV